MAKTVFKFGAGILLGATLLAACGETDVSLTETNQSQDVESQVAADDTVDESSEAVVGEQEAEEEVTPSTIAPDVAGFNIEAVDLSSRETVVLADLVDGTKPVVVWGWAPHCGTCLAEVAEYNEFVAENPDVQVIGIGQTDSLELAYSFFEAGQPDFPLVYSTGGDIWNEADLGFQRFNVYSADLTKKATQPFHFSNTAARDEALLQLA